MPRAALRQEKSFSSKSSAETSKPLQVTWIPTKSPHPVENVVFSDTIHLHPQRASPSRNGYMVPLAKLLFVCPPWAACPPNASSPPTNPESCWLGIPAQENLGLSLESRGELRGCRTQGLQSLSKRPNPSPRRDFMERNF